MPVIIKPVVRPAIVPVIPRRRIAMAAPVAGPVVAPTPLAMKNGGGVPKGHKFSKSTCK